MLLNIVVLFAANVKNRFFGSQILAQGHISVHSNKYLWYFFQAHEQMFQQKYD